MSKGLTGEQIAEKHARRLTAAIPDMRDAVDRVTVNPMEKAANSMDKMRARYLEAIDSGKVQRGFKRVSLDEWKDAYKRNVDRVASGIENAKPKTAKFFTELNAYQSSYLPDVHKMPSTTFEQNLERMRANAVAMKKFQRKG